MRTLIEKLPQQQTLQGSCQPWPLKQRQSAIWQTFLSAEHTLANVNRDFIEWHHGRKQFALWAISLGVNPWIDIIGAAREHLKDFFLPEEKRQPHITLFVCGFPSVQEIYQDDFAIDRFADQFSSLFESPQSTWTLSLGKLSSYTSSAFFEIDDANGDIDKVRALLGKVGPELRQSSYLPHLTVGLYSSVFETSLVAKRIKSFRFCKQSPINVSKISLMIYDPAQIAGELKVIYEFDFIVRIGDEIDKMVPDSHRIIVSPPCHLD